MDPLRKGKQTRHPEKIKRRDRREDGRGGEKRNGGRRRT